jgi:DivIVA domain-containing protein
MSLRGYSVAEVDEFLEQVTVGLEARRTGPALQFDDAPLADNAALIERIRHVQFRLAVRGYDVDQVDDFLEGLARAIGDQPVNE